MTTNKLPRWFLNRLRTVMKHNEYEENMLTVEECTKKERWTPTDLILREIYNNGGGSAKGFLGLTRAETWKCYYFIRDNQKLLQELDYYNKEGWNNCGIGLWSNYEIR